MMYVYERVWEMLACGEKFFWQLTWEWLLGILFENAVRNVSKRSDV